ncbi:hypothetical protein MMAD_01430 [Mycolicibacterium madagascariense]|uniref:Carboxylesterase n=1 Tax=Mycolicibacterium madagascariense TaxID=212765 RepID=A0A7I7XBV4_9MYCO|nr:hypothetical protein MMAD_01430 [Mycolicibacterium madagascariense]
MGRQLLGMIGVAVVLLCAGCGSDQQAPASSSSGSPSGSPTSSTAVSEPPRTTPDGLLLVSPDNFVRAESDMEMANVVRENGFGQFFHNRDVTPIDKQLVVRANRDTLYSAAVFDVAAAPVTITMPDPGQRFMSMQVITEDQYVPAVFYGKGEHTLTQHDVGTRYVIAVIRTLANPNDPTDLATARALQNAIGVKQDGKGTFEIPRWDPLSQKTVRDALLTLAATLPDTKGMFGTPTDTDPVRHLIGTASAWGGNPPRDAIYLDVTPARNDGATVYRLTAKDVPVQAFWSISVYDKDGYFTPNSLNAYSLNDITAAKNPDGSITVQFGGCTPTVANCLPVTPGWNYMVRLYRPQAAILDGKWTFPDAQPA